MKGLENMRKTKLLPRKRRMKENKVAPNWMDCNCQCHGFYDNTALDCPHCRPDRYKDWTVLDIKSNEPNL